jgi:hypothetical protein
MGGFVAIDFIVSDVIPASPDEIYAAWFDSETPTDMTGGAATASDEGPLRIMPFGGLEEYVS